MNTLERRITDALRAYGEGLDMTAKDIDRLEQELEPRQEAHRQQRRNRIWQAAVAACAVTGVVLGALALRGDPEPPKVPTGPPAQTTKGLEGIWLLNDGSGYLWTFSVDGKLRYTNQPYDPLVHTDSSGEPAFTYRYTPDGFILDGSGDCDDVFAATISADGRLRATVMGTTGSGCPSEAPRDPSEPPEVYEFTRISPKSVAGAQLPVPDTTAGESLVNRLDNLVGTWLFPGSGTLLTVTASGVYSVSTFDSLYRPQTGMLSVTRSGGLVFSPTDSPRCDAVYTAWSRTTTVHVTPQAGSCRELGDAAEADWIRLN